MSITVYDTPSGLGGSFTVSILREIDAERVEVRIWSGRNTWRGWESASDFDGVIFTPRRADLGNPRQMKA